VATTVPSDQTRPEQIRPQQIRVSPASRRAGAAIFAVIALATLAGIIVSAVNASRRNDPYSEARQDLDDALRKVPFDLRLPSTLPAGERHLRTYLKEPGVDEGTVFQLSTWYIRPGADTTATQIWQTNEGYLKRRALDPTQQDGREVVVNKQSWWRLDGSREERNIGVSYSRREDDGVTLVISGPSDAAVTDMISRLGKVEPIDPERE
jgi:hypothetical protein